MPSTVKPAWLLDYSKLLDITSHLIFMPADIPNITSIKDDQAFKSGIRQYLFWKGQLLPSVPQNTIFLAFLSPEGLQHPNVLNVTAALKDICDLSQVCEFYQGANTCFLALSFNSIQPINQIISHFKFFNDSVVLTFTHQSSQQHRFRLLWLPPMFAINRVHHLLNKYSTSHRIRRESIAFAGNTYSPTNVISGTLTVKPGVDIATLPYLIQLPAPHRGCALLTIEARPPLCLKCRAVGHTRPHCRMTRCPHCDKVHFPEDSCGVSSYSAVASRNITPCSTDDWFAGLSDTPPTPVQPSSSYDKLTPSQVTTLPLHHDTSPELPEHQNAVTSHSTLVIHTDITAECDRTSDGSTNLLATASALQSHFHHASFSEPVSQCPATNLTSLNKIMDHHSSTDTLPVDDSSLISTNVFSTPSHPMASFSRSKEHSKVHVIDHPPPPSTVARSHLITYSTSGKGTTPLSSRSAHLLPPSAHSTIFEESEPDFFSSSDIEVSSDPGDPSSSQDMLCEDSTSRKRKITLSPAHSPPESPAPTHLSDDISLKPPSLDVSSISISKQSLDSIIQSGTNSDLETYQGQISFRQRVANIFAADMEQICLLEQQCPDGTFTTDLIKIFKLFFENGIFISHILASPFILKLRFAEIKRKIGFLKKHLSIITIGDISQQGHLEDKILTGASLTPSTFFS